MKKQIILKKEKLRIKVRQKSAPATRVVKSKKLYKRETLTVAECRSKHEGWDA